MGKACQSSEAVAVEDSAKRINKTAAKTEEEKKMTADDSSDDDFEAECGKIETRNEASRGAKMALNGK